MPPWVATTHPVIATLAPPRSGTESGHSRVAQRDGTALFTSRQVFLPLSIACAVGVGVIAVLARDRMVALAGGASFAAASVIALLLATSWGDAEGRFTRARRVLAVALLGASAALPGWFFGPSSAYAGVLAILLLFSGLLMGGVATPYPAAAAWSVYASIAGGQLAIAVLVFTGTIRDASLLPLLPAGASGWHHVACHATVQLVFAAAFSIGRALHTRYWAVSEELDMAVRSAARRDALLDEARAEYRRTFALGREGMFAGHTIGRYQLGGLIGRGGTGEVYDARDLVDGSLVAVKLLRSDRLDDPTRVRGFLEEATALIKIDSPHVVRARHVGSIDDALPYIAMERLDGTTLAQHLAATGPLDPTTLRQLVEDGSRALDAVHRAGICHGDVNPNNLILANGGWKLIDFSATRSADAAGTAHYISPERRAGAPRTPADDVYGLCASIATAISGRLPGGEPSTEMAATNDKLGTKLAAALADRYTDATALREAVVAACGPAQRPSPLPTQIIPAPVLDVRPAPELAPTLRASSPSLDQVASSAWRGAFADKMRLQYACVLLACILGAALIGLIVRDGAMLALAWGTIAVAAIIVALERTKTREWPWVIVGALAVGPAYVLGLHSGFAAVIAVTLFVESSFRSGEAGVTGRGWTLVAVLVTHSLAFVAIMLRVIPDGHVTGILHHTPWWSAVAIQLLILGIYGGAFAIGHIVYARYAELVRTNERAARDAAAKEALLATARAEIERVLQGYAGGLFTGSKIGAYEIEALIGRGGMGEVYAARRDSQRVALKVVRSDRIANARILKRFANEAETLLRVDSQYVARVLDVGTEDGRLPFLVMELVEGVSLAEQLRGRDRLELGAVRVLIRDIARGLADCHRAGVIHRDVKPHNLVLTSIDRGAIASTQHWKLVDFGIAKLPNTSRTTGGVIVGTPAYMAPEQLVAGDADVRSDLYSLSLVIFRTLAGRPAFTGMRPERQHPPDPYRIANLPLDLRHALRIGLAMEPADRFASAIELEAAFDAAFEGRLDAALRARALALKAREPWS